MKNYKFDASNYVLGRLASEVAVILQGKNDPFYERYLAKGGLVEVFNCDKIKITGNKLKDKIYFHHSGYLGGIKSISLEKLLQKDSRQVIKKAVFGMLPKNKLRSKMIKKLILYKLQSNDQKN